VIRSFVKIFGIVILVAALSQPILYWYGKQFWQDVYKRPRGVLCDKTKNRELPVLVVEDSKNIDSLLAYYKRVQLNQGNIDGVTFNVPLLTIACYDTIYIMSSIRSDSVFEFISTNDRGAHFGNGYLHGYAHARYLITL
jgi:hypothetical protein